MAGETETVPNVLAEEVRADDRSRELETARLPDHLDRLFRAAIGLCGNRHDAEDLVQETYALVLRRKRLLRGEDERAYLMRALRNTWIKRRTSADARLSILSSPDRFDAVRDPRPQPQTLALEAQAALAAVAELAPKLRETIVAVDVIGLSYKEAARALRVRPGTIMSRLHRAREGVAEALEGART